MDQLRALRTFIAVADHSSFAKAAGQLHQSPTTVSRTIAALEASLGVALLSRTTRSVRLTREGAAFLDQCRAGLVEIDSAFESARGVATAPSGTLTVTAPVMFGRLHVLPIVTELIETYPGLNVRLLLLDRVVRLVEEGVDVAVRIADLPDSSLHMRKIAEVRRVLSASPDYLARRGVPRQHSDLSRHQMIMVEDEQGAYRPDERELSRPGRAKTRLWVNNMQAGIDAAIAGMGIIRSLSYQVEEPLASGRLVPVLEASAEPGLPVSLLYQSHRKDTPSIRAFTQMAVSKLQRSSF